MTLTVSKTVANSSASAATAGDKLAEALQIAHDQHDRTLLDLTNEQAQLVVFLRHSGCPFCREASSDLSHQRKHIERDGVSIVLVHMMNESQAETFFDSYGLGDLPRISDPQQQLYRAFDLKRGNLWQIGGPKVWWRVIQARLTGHRIGKVVGDAFQMPGVFLVHEGRILHAFRHRSQADRPDYTRISACASNEA